MCRQLYSTFQANPQLGSRCVKSGMWTYLVDLAKLTQMNVDHHAHTVRSIRRVAK